MSYNTRSPAVKRLMKEAQELSEPTELFYAKPLEDNLFEWHFTIRGPTDTDYDSGIYHGRILLPAEYPMKPPNILLMTPSGRFEINRKICLSISGYHPETWRPSWSIRTALLAIIGFMPTHGIGAIGSLDYPSEERRKLAKISSDFVCPECGSIKNVLKSLTEASVDDVKEAKDLASQISFTGDKAVDKSVEPVESKPTCSEVTKGEELQCQPLPQPQPLIPWDVLIPTDNLLVNNEHMPFLPAMHLKPLSFEEWYQQVKCTEQTQPKGGSVKAAETDTVDATSLPIQSFVSLDESSQINAQETIIEATNSITNSASPSDPTAPPLQPDIELTNEIRQRNTPPAESVSVVNNRQNIDLVSIRNRQNVLLKCIIFLAGVLGLVLAARWNNIHSEINN